VKRRSWGRPEARPLPLDAWQLEERARPIAPFGTSTPCRLPGPVGRFPTRRMHRRSRRTVAELPGGLWRGGRRVRVRKWCCANGRGDAAAVRAGVSLPWRGGPVAGQSNRLTMLTRQRWGRAHLDLLPPRVRLAA
jgi:hypothetical protein